MSVYIYSKTEKIAANLIRIEVARKVIDLLPQLPHIEANFRYKSLLKSSLYSARIEGNTLELYELEGEQVSKKRERLEVLNIVKALEWIYKENREKAITTKTMLELHRLVMKGLTGDAGSFRREPTAILNDAGIAVYMTPPPAHLPYLLDELISTLAKEDDHPVINAARAHFSFEKIHPFVDGNGRVGRLLSSLILKNKDYAMHSVVSVEEYLNDHKESYYELLGQTGGDITSFIEFYLEAMAVSAESAYEELKSIRQEKPEDSLLPRRAEILSIIRDHPHCSFDTIRRRFPTVALSTLHYDLQHLMKKGFVRKLGNTRGVLYKIKEDH